jgi:hypothetical protein
MFLSALELRNIIESSFLPKRCQCTLSPDLSMTVKVFGDHQTDQVDLHVSGIDASHLNGCREINDLIAGLRSDLRNKPRTSLQPTIQSRLTHRFTQFDRHAPGLHKAEAQRELDQHREQNPGAGMAVEPFAKPQHRQTQTTDDKPVAQALRPSDGGALRTR